jgi:hypothetical protein
MKNGLTERQIELLEALCGAGDSAHAGFVKRATANTLSPNEIEILCELISNELMMKGIEETFEPNAYGLELEALLDAINRSRLQDKGWSG